MPRPRLIFLILSLIAATISAIGLLVGLASTRRGWAKVGGVFSPEVEIGTLGACYDTDDDGRSCKTWGDFPLLVNTTRREFVGVTAGRVSFALNVIGFVSALVNVVLIRVSLTYPSPFKLLVSGCAVFVILCSLTSVTVSLAIWRHEWKDQGGSANDVTPFYAWYCVLVACISSLVVAIGSFFIFTDVWIPPTDPEEENDTSFTPCL